jgi:hypothetical protein
MKDTEKKAKVFVVQEVSKFNVISAQEYGQLVPLYEEGKQIMLSPGPAIRKAKTVVLLVLLLLIITEVNTKYLNMIEGLIVITQYR